MEYRIEPGAQLSGTTAVPGDKSIAHRWLMLAASAKGTSVIRGLPAALDVRSTARCLAALLPDASALGEWAENASTAEVSIAGTGFAGLGKPADDLDCGNSGTTMRLLSGILAGRPLQATLVGDESLTARPMERVAEPLRLMGAHVETTEGHAPITIRGGDIKGITYATPVPSAQVKSAVLLAGVQASDATSVEEQTATRDHTERALAALGAEVAVESGRVTIGAHQHEGFEADVPGDPSSAAFVLAAAAATGGDVAVRDVGLNTTRTRFLEVMRRMGVAIRTRELWESLHEPAGLLEVAGGTRLRGTTVPADELPLVIDEVPVLAALAALAEGESRFQGAGELRVKESDRLWGVAEGLRSLGAEVAVEGDALIVAGGGLSGGRADSRGDHRLAMALAVAAIGGGGDSFISGMEWADVTFPGFGDTLVALGALLEPT